MKTFLLILFMMSSSYAGRINVAVSANLSYVIEALKAEFSKSNPDIRVQITLGSSGKLAAQISNGAPYGIFMSANMKYPQLLFKDKIAITQPLVYAQGKLALFSVENRDLSQGLALLKDNDIRKIAVANAKTAPYGKASLEAMKKIKVYKSVKSKLVYAESISQVVFYTLKAADIGIIAKSSLFGRTMSGYKENVHWVDIDTRLYAPIKQGFVLLKYAQRNNEYKMFYDFVLSKKGQNIFKRYGYSNE